LTRRLSTNLSEKHWQILEDLTAKYGSQRKTLEALLDGSGEATKPLSLSREDEIKLYMSRNKTMVIVPKKCFTLLIEGQLLEAIQAAVDGTEMAVEEMLRKPFKESSLKEVIQVLMEMSMAYNLITSWKLTEHKNDEYERSDYDYALTSYHNEGELYGNALASVLERALQKKGAIAHSTSDHRFGEFITIKEGWEPKPSGEPMPVVQE
jgi:hypothetical protein